MTDYRTPEIKKQQDAFICSLINNEKVYRFANELLFGLIKKSKQIDLPSEMLIKILSTVITNGKILEKPGYSKDMCEKIITFNRVEQLLQFNRINGITFLQIMGALYEFEYSNVFWKLIMDNSKTLKKIFLTTMQQYFSIPKSLGYSQITDMINNSDGYWFYPLILMFMSNNNKNIFHRNLSNETPYIRKKNDNKSIKYINRQDLLDCKQQNLKNFKETDILLGTTYYVPIENGIWSNLMKRYKKEIIAGPSGSCLLTYQMVFNIAKIKKSSKNNKIMLLYCILADYYQLYHSISEVLQEYSVDAKFKKYNLSMNDLEYIKKIKKVKSNRTIVGQQFANQ